MKTLVKYSLNGASAELIADHLLCCDTDFIPPLSGRVEINDYAQKIVNKATRFEAWSGSALVGLVAVYCSDQQKHVAFITSVSVLRAWTGSGIATQLLGQCIDHARVLGMQQIRLEVSGDNAHAIRVYKKSGFVTEKANALFVSMSLVLKSGEAHE